MHLRTPRLSDERGMALALAVFALVIIGALVAGTFFIGQLEQRSGLNTMFAAQAAEAADAGNAATIGGWTSAFNGRAVNTDTVLPVVSLGGGNQYQATVRRLSSASYLIRTEGTHLDAGGTVQSRRLVGQFVKLLTPNIPVQGALTIRGTLTLGGSSLIDGTDHVPAGWGASCPLSGTPQAGIRTNTGTINTNGANCAGSPPACVLGSPRVLVDASVTATTFTDFGSTSFDALAAAATWQISGTVNGIAPSSTGSPAACQLTNNRNWGEPNTGVGSVPSCFNYFPIMYAPGDVRITGGRGQGILLVRGDLDLSGGVEFFGPVIVLGNVTSTGTGGHVYGGLLASNADLQPSTITGNSVVDYSACSVQRALAGVAVATPFTERSWAQLY